MLTSHVSARMPFRLLDRGAVLGRSTDLLACEHLGPLSEGSREVGEVPHDLDDLVRVAVPPSLSHEAHGPSSPLGRLFTFSHRARSHLDRKSILDRPEVERAAIGRRPGCDVADQARGTFFGGLRRTAWVDRALSGLMNDDAGQASTR
ncbi:hypothetical protein GCM10009600_29390 [Oerskovia paurometabola]